MNPCSATRSCTRCSGTAAWAITTPPPVSTSSIAFMRSIDSTISPAIGMVAPTSPVMPPWVVTGTRARWQIVRNRETSSVECGRITASGGGTETPAMSV